MTPDELERRLVAAGHDVVGTAPVPPRASAAVAQGRRLRTRRIRLVTAAGAAALAVAVTGPLVTGEERASRITSIPPPTTPSTTTSEAPPVSDPVVDPAPTTTAPAPSAAPAPTTARPATQPVGPAPTTTTSAPGRPEVDGVTGGYWIVRLDGSGLRRISAEGGFMTWSPTGDRLAFATPNWIWKLPTDAGQPAATVASGTDRYPLCMDWSSTGDLAWVTDRGDLIVAIDGDQFGRTVGPGFGNVVRCKWSPDGRSLAVVRYASVSIVDRNGAVLWDWPLVAGPPDGGYPTTWFEWSPDGQRLAVSGRVGDDPRNPRYGLFVASVDGPAPDGPVFTPQEWRDVTHVSWDRRDGDVIHVQAGHDSGAEQHVVDVVERSARLVTTPGTRLDALTDGRFLAFRATAEGGQRKELVVVEPDRSSTRRLAFGRAPDPAGPVMSECRGTYFIDKRVSPKDAWVAFRTSASYGPRCDSPAF